MAKDKNKEKVTLEFDKSIIEEIDRYALENESDRSKVIRTAVKKFFNLSPVVKTGKKTI
jgi:metal-responsive CopG/Arc/MetJ family transcriptional regulator